MIPEYSGTWQQVRFLFWTHVSPVNYMLFLVRNAGQGSQWQGLEEGCPLPTPMLSWSASELRAAGLLCGETDVLRLQTQLPASYQEEEARVEAGCVATSRIHRRNVTLVSLARTWGLLSDHTDTQNKKQETSSYLWAESRLTSTEEITVVNEVRP